MWIVAGILLVATTLRAPFTAAGPLLGQVAASYGISSGEAGFLITLPLLGFCLVSPFSARLADALGLERSLFAALIVMALGIGTRSAGPLWALYVGSVLLGAGIAVGNTLLPSLLKRDFPDQITRLTGLYAISMGLASAAASAAVVPLAQASDWRLSLLALMGLPIAAAVVWSPQLHRRSVVATRITTAPERSGGVWTSALAWQVTLFFAVNSFVYYAVAAWLPSILAANGISAQAAGALHGIMQLASAAPGLVLAPLVQRMKDQRGLAAGFALTAAASLGGLHFAPKLALLWVSLFGFGIGGGFILALAFIGLRTRSAEQTARLSGKVQSVGYVLSASGPIAIGAVHDAFGGWTAPLTVCGALCVVLIGLGLGAGRDRHIA